MLQQIRGVMFLWLFDIRSREVIKDCIGTKLSFLKCVVYFWTDFKDLAIKNVFGLLYFTSRCGDSIRVLLCISVKFGHFLSSCVGLLSLLLVHFNEFFAMLLLLLH